MLSICAALIKPQPIMSKSNGSLTFLKSKNTLKMQYTKNTINAIISKTSDRNRNCLPFLAFVVNSFKLILFSLFFEIRSTIWLSV